MNRYQNVLLRVIIIFVILFATKSEVHASDYKNNITSVSLQDSIDNIFTFNELGYSERIMTGPYDSTTMLFGLPPTWQLQDGGKIFLRYSFSFTGSNQPLVGGTLFVYFNNTVVDTIYLNQTGEFTQEINIPASALQSSSEDGRHYLGLLFDASINCSDQDLNSSLIINEESEVIFSYTNVPPILDLSKFPNPLYQQTSVVKIPTTIVIPDQPSVLEIQSALAVSAGLGAVTDEDFEFELVTLSNLSNDAQISNNLIFVGLPASLPLLQNTLLPIPPVGSSIPLNGINVDDGIIQISLSSWNPTRVMMFVSGNSEAGLVKAASVIGSANIFTSGRPDIVIVGDVNAEDPTAPVPDSRTLLDLGYKNTTFGDTAGQYASYSFYVSAEQSASVGAYIDVVTSRSNLLDFEQSGLSLVLNGEIISTLSFSEDAGQIETTRVSLLPNILRRGNNILEVVTSLRPKGGCYSKDFENNWITISDTSTIVTPGDGQKFDFSRNINLDNFPYFLLGSDNLSNIAFVVPENDQASWNQASKLAYYLGNVANLVIPDVATYYGNGVPENALNEKDLIVVGRATSLPIVSEINESLPAPFENGTDEAIQPAMLVNYRLLPGVSVGYLQLITSPWNADHAILMILGNTNDGIPMAGNSLLNSDISLQLQGDFAVIYNDQVVSTDTRLGPVKESIIGELPIVATTTPSQNETSLTPSPDQPQEVQTRAGWILPVLGIIILLVVGVTIFVVRGRRLNKGVDKEKNKDEKEE